MNSDQKIELLKRWQEVSKGFDKASSDYMDLTWCPREAPHIETAYSVSDEYTKLVAESTGIPFDELLCWAYELGYGEIAAYEPKVNGTRHTIRTIEELFWFWDDLNKD